MPRIKNGFLFTAIVLVIATSQAQGQTIDLLPPIDTSQQKSISRLIPAPKIGPSSLPLIDDCIAFAVDAFAVDGLALESDQPTVITCQLNAPIENDSESSADACSMDQYCEQVATHLMTTLDGSATNSEAKKRAIRTALTMVAEKSNLAAKAETKKLQESHQQTLKQILMEHTRKGQSGFVEEDKSLLEPVYATQFRNTKQLKKLADADQSILQSLFALEQKFASFTLMQRAKLSGTEVRRIMNSLEEEEAREREVAKLQAELQVLDRRIQQLQSNPVRHASHLEPLYMPAQPLRPISDPLR